MVLFEHKNNDPFINKDEHCIEYILPGSRPNLELTKAFAKEPGPCGELLVCLFVCINGLFSTMLFPARIFSSIVT